MIENNKSEAIIIRVSPELKSDLKRMADADSRKLSDFIRLQLQKLAEVTKKRK